MIKFLGMYTCISNHWCPQSKSKHRTKSWRNFTSSYLVWVV